MGSVLFIIRRFFVLAVLWPGLVCAQTLEVIPLQHRSAEQLIPQLRPFLDPGAALTGMNEKLFVRTSAKNLAQLRELIAAMDTPVRRLLISLRSDGEVSRGGTAGAYSSDRHSRDDIFQQVQTIDGGRAVLRVGQTFVLPMRQLLMGQGGTLVAESLVQREVGSGFVVVPQLLGDTVTLEISPQIESLSSPTGVSESQRLSTTVSGPLGQWIVLGGAEDSPSGVVQDGARYSSRTRQQQRRILIKVELLGR